MTGPQDFSHLLSDECKRRPTLSLTSTFKYLQDPEFIFLGGGLPQSSLFPWDKIQAHSPLPQNLGKPSDTSNEVVTEIHRSAVNGEIPINQALQYGPVKGQPQLLNFLKEHTQRYNNVPYGDWDIIMNTGNTQGLDVVLRTFINVGDSLLCEEYTFGASLTALKTTGANIIPVVTDEEGIIPEKLEATLANWNVETNGPLPKLLYTIPTGQNPTGSNLPVSRKQQIYKIAQKYNFLIIEDDPYYFLQMGEDHENTDAEITEEDQVTFEEFSKSLIKTFLSMDIDGRVIRLESLSKVLAPGTRLGWIVAQNSILEHLLRVNEASFLNVSGFTQSLIYGLLSQWGHDGFLKWLIALKKTYTAKRNVTSKAVGAHMNTKIVHYSPPSAGMFFILKLDAAKHPRFQSEFNGDVQKVEDKIFKCLLDHKILLLNSGLFRTVDRKVTDSDTTFFFRGTYAAGDAETINNGLKRFSEAVTEEFTA